MQLYFVHSLVQLLPETSQPVILKKDSVITHQYREQTDWRTLLSTEQILNLGNMIQERKALTVTAKGVKTVLKNKKCIFSSYYPILFQFF